jgi:hypothetical protein
MLPESYDRGFVVDLVASEKEGQRMRFDAQQLACSSLERMVVDLVS